MDFSGAVVYDTYCKPDQPITDYRTRWSGILPEHMENSIPFDVVTKKVAEVLTVSLELCPLNIVATVSK